MKKALFIIGLALFTATYAVAFSTNMNVATPGTLSSLLSAYQKTTLTELTVTGCIDARDVKCMRDELSLLAALDLSAANIMAYAGTAGTAINSTKSVIYPANQLPANSFFMSTTNTGKSTLRNLKLPNTLTSIGIQACYSCIGLTGSLVIPASVSSIGSLAFYNCSGLAKIAIESVIPPIIQYSTFMNVYKSTCVLEVPIGVCAVYRAADYWGEFAAITEPFSVLVNYGLGGEVRLNNSTIKDNAVVTISSGSSVTFSFMPNGNYMLAGLMYNNVNVFPQVVNNQYTTPAVSKNGVLLATFIMKQYNLLIKNSDGATTNLICDYGATPTFNLTPAVGKKISSVFFNDRDVTASLLNGVYTVPPITTNSTLKVLYSILTGLQSDANVGVKVYGRQSEIIIDGSATGDVVQVYSLSGVTIKEIRSAGERLTIPLAKGNVYIVRVANKTTKVVL